MEKIAEEEGAERSFPSTFSYISHVFLSCSYVCVCVCVKLPHTCVCAWKYFKEKFHVAAHFCFYHTNFPIYCPRNKFYGTWFMSLLISTSFLLLSLLWCVHPINTVLHSCYFWQNIAEMFKIAFGIILGNWSVILGLGFESNFCWWKFRWKGREC